MTKEEVFELLNQNPVFYLATVEKDQPRVRGMLLFRADENGIIFHTASSKDVYAQISENPKAEMSFFGNGVQVRVTGVLEEVFDDKLKTEIYTHPSRQFLRDWKANGIGDEMLRIFVLKNGVAVRCTMEDNFKEKEFIQL